MAFTNTTSLAKKKWDVYIYSLASGWTNSDGTWGTKVGQLDGDASLKSGIGDTLKLATGIEAQISENGEVNFTIVGQNTTAAAYATNYTELKSLINNPSNVMFLPAGSTPASTENVKIKGLYLFPELNIQANQLNKIIISGKVENGPGESVLMNQANNQ